jgi:hypothetical protein
MGDRMDTVDRLGCGRNSNRSASNAVSFALRMWPAGCCDQHPAPRHNIAEKMTEIARDVVSGLKGTPMLLGMLVLNIAFLGAGIYFLLKFGEANAARFELILNRCLPAAQG